MATLSRYAMIFAFILLVPPLTITLLYFLYQFYIQANKKNIIVNILSDSSHQIIEQKNKKKTTIAKENKNIILKKLNYAGFIHNYAQYIFILISLGFGVGIGIFIYIVMGSPIALVITSIMFSFFPYLVLNKIIATRQEEFNFGLQSIIDKVTSMMKSGVGFEQAFKKSILTSKSKFTKEILGMYINEKDIIGEEKVFEKMFELVESKELRIFYLVVSIGKQSGGKFSNTLDALRKALHDQGTIKQEITASTKEIKVGTYMIIGLTIGMYMMMDNVFDGALNEHFFGSSEGKLEMFFIVLWVSFGIFINNMMTKIKG